MDPQAVPPSAPAVSECLVDAAIYQRIAAVSTAARDTGNPPRVSIAWAQATSIRIGKPGTADPKLG